MLKGKNVVITGANRGIGRAVTEVFTENGADVWACCRKPSEEFETMCGELSRRSGGRVTPVYFEMTDPAQMKEAFKTIKDSKLPVDGLVNVAGSIFSANFQMTSESRHKELFEINYFSQAAWTQYILKIMSRQKSGSVVNMASSAGIDCNEGRTAYNTSKAAVIAYSKTLAREVGKIGIRVNSLAPGLTRTDMGLSTPEDVLNAELEKTSLKRMGEPREIAAAAMFLISDLSSYITGQVIRCDGGL